MVGFLRVLFLLPFFLTLFSSFAHAQVPTGVGTIDINATVPPKSSDIEFNLSASVPADTELGEGDEVTFTISYRSLVAGSFPLEMEAFWEQGLIEGSGGSYVDVYEYVVGSASNAHNGSPAVVDLLNNKITWNINNLTSSATPHTVTFKLRVRDNLPTTNRIETYIKARGEFASTPIPIQSYRLYSIKGAALPTVTPTFTPAPTSRPGSPTSVPGSEPTATPRTGTANSPTPTIFKGRSDIPPLQFFSVNIEQLTDEYVQISTVLSVPASLSIQYGICGQKLTQITSIDSEQERHILDIHGLTPDTQYCFILKAQDISNKRSIQSDIFTFRTASDKELFKIDNPFITWNNLLLNSGKGKKLVIPPEKPITISFNTQNAESLDDIKGSFHNANVLGVTTMTTGHIENVKFIEISKGFFSAEIMSPRQKGTYNFIVEIKDVYGSFMKKSLPVSFVVSDPLMVINKSSGKPIENARVMIDKMEESTQRYKSLQQSFAFSSLEDGVFLPYHTNDYGILDIILPPGKYKMEVSAVGYETSYRDISLGIDVLSYPTIQLQSRMSPESYIKYTVNALDTALTFVPFYANKFFSTRIILIVALVIQVLLFITSLFLVAFKQRLYNHIDSASEVNMNVRLGIIQLMKVGIIACILISIFFVIMFSLYQNIIVSLPFIVSVILLIFFVFYTKTKSTDLA